MEPGRDDQESVFGVPFGVYVTVPLRSPAVITGKGKGPDCGVVVDLRGLVLSRALIGSHKPGENTVPDIRAWRPDGRLAVR